VRRLFLALLVLTGAVALALYARQDPGYVVIQFRGWTIEASLILLVVALIAGFLLLYLLVRFLVTGLRLPATMRDWRRRRRQRLALETLERGFTDLLDGRWERAERRLARGVVPGEGALLSYYGAARAAHELGAADRRDGYLQAAGAARPAAEIGLAAAQAEMQIASGQYAQAAASLDRLRAMAPKNALVLMQLMRLRLQVGDWERLLELLPVLRRQRLIDEERAEGLERRAALGLLQSPVLQDGDDLEAAWARLPKGLREREELIQAYVHRLAECGAASRAESVLRAAIEREWRPGLVHLYGLIEADDPERRLRRAETWLRRHPGDPVLLLCLGRICRRNALWGKARDYLESSVAGSGTAEALGELALVLEETGESEAALDRYRQAAIAAVESERRALGTGTRLLAQP